jgi:hypothetical protein
MNLNKKYNFTVEAAHGNLFLEYAGYTNLFNSMRNNYDCEFIPSPYCGINVDSVEDDKPIVEVSVR